MAKYKEVSFDEMMSEVQQYIKRDENIALIKKAYFYAEEKHKGQLRKSGDPYIIHPIQVAYSLAKLKAGPTTIAASLLHDVIEDCEVDENEFIETFGQEIFTLVDSVSKIKKIQFVDEKEYLAANHRKILIAMAKDIRVILIKLCDRLHNMNTLQYVKEEKQKKTAQETLEVYAPIAHRLGISEIKNELEDLSFYYLDRDKYYEIARQVEVKRTERDAQVQDMIHEIKTVLEGQNIKFRIFGRSKHLYSIYNKMVTRNKRFDEILDLLAIRIITQTDLECYEVLGYIHANFTPIPGRLKDYIAMPKFNMYQSLHTSVINGEGNIFEIQIRTEEMDEIAERGVAAHWRYKEGKYNAVQEQKEIEEKLSLFRDIVSIKDDGDVDDQEFMETLQKDFFDTNVYVMSPKGRVIDLPSGSTPIDFAYRIHTEVGHSTIGATVNGILVPLNTVLKTGDVVNLRTSKQSAGPSEDWLKIVKTSHARNKIKNYLAKKELESRTPTIEKGEEMFKEELEKRQLDAEWSNPKKLETIYRQYSLKDYNDFMYAIGTKSISLNSAMEKISKNKTNILSNSELSSLIASKNEGQKKFVSKSGIRVAGIDSIMISLAGCCSPVAGDEIVGFISKGNGVKVHRKDCPNIINEKNRLIEVEWDDNRKESRYEVVLYIEATDRNFLLTDLVTVLSQNKVALHGINSQLNADKVNTTTTMRIVVENSEHLRTVIANLMKVSSVTKVERAIQ